MIFWHVAATASVELFWFRLWTDSQSFAASARSCWFLAASSWIFAALQAASSTGTRRLNSPSSVCAFGC
jgi:hypothetical protein